MLRRREPFDLRRFVMFGADDLHLAKTQAEPSTSLTSIFLLPAILEIALGEI
ncbi:MAG: hypothetical protein GY725_10175 [bacterium]|nr:hypothetical protein [bacterium]